MGSRQLGSLRTVQYLEGSRLPADEIHRPGLKMAGFHLLISRQSEIGNQGQMIRCDHRFAGFPYLCALHLQRSLVVAMI